MDEQKILYANGLTLSVTDGEARLLFTVSTPVVGENGEMKSVMVEDVADIRVNNVVLKQISDTLSKGIENFSKVNHSNEASNE